jgi:hypothetical protein
MQDHDENQAKKAKESEASHELRRLEALKAIRKLRRPLPPGYKFNREEINDRELARREAREQSAK